jgi:hypothetical protein
VGDGQRIASVTSGGAVHDAFLAVNGYNKEGQALLPTSRMVDMADASIQGGLYTLDLRDGQVIKDSGDGRSVHVARTGKDDFTVVSINRNTGRAELYTLEKTVFDGINPLNKFAKAEDAKFVRDDDNVIALLKT